MERQKEIDAVAVIHGGGGSGRIWVLGCLRILENREVVLDVKVDGNKEVVLDVKTEGSCILVLGF